MIYQNNNGTLNPLAGTPTARLQSIDNNISDIENKTGYKNLISYPYCENSRTRNGITYIINDDGSITANGTATTSSEGYSYFNIQTRIDTTSNLNRFPSGKLVFSGITNGSQSTYRMWIGHTNESGTNTTDIILYNGEEEFVGDSSYYYTIQIRINDGVTVNNLTFYPMVRYESISDNTFVSPKKKDKIDTHSEAIKNIVNIYGAKNLIPYPYTETTETKNGVTFTDNGDGTITANGTATANTQFFIIDRILQGYQLPEGKYILSGCDNYEDYSYRLNMLDSSGSGGTNETIGNNYNGDTIFEVTSNSGNLGLNFYVTNGAILDNVTFKPMIRAYGIEDSTYEPYAQTNKELTDNKISWESNGIIGAKNLLVYPYNYTTRTVNGITFTDNGDGSITANGTATADAYFNLSSWTTTQLNKGNYIINGCPSGSSSTTYFLNVTWKNTEGSNVSQAIYEDEAKITVASNTTTTYIDILIRNGQTVSNLTFYPMVRIADDNDDTYRPYAMTNRELTTTSGTITYNTTYITDADIHWIKSGKLVVVTAAIQMNGTTIAGGTELLYGIPEVAEYGYATPLSAQGNTFKLYAKKNTTTICKDESQTVANTWYNFTLAYLAK